MNIDKNSTKSKILHSTAKLFIESGYSNTRIKDISKDANVQYNEIFRIFVDKDTLLSQLVDLVLMHQAECVEEFLKSKTTDKLIIYAFDRILQLYIAESVDHIREMYEVSYSLPNSSHKIYNLLSNKVEEVFQEYLPSYEKKDFYELEIASAGIMRGYIINPCTMYFTMDRKVRKFIETTFKIYNVPNYKIEETLNFINQYDMNFLAKKVIDSLLEYIVSRT